ncbi:MAG: homoserine dehydrogenase [Candidatus Bathyarchaeota archaeon BA1]|nr:MAG: homoserine dehydrogenase [Candidatus Bathyarchaeota archaeon BA1]
MRLNLAFIGFGVVGQGFAQILVNKRALLRRKYNLEYDVVAISDVMKGSVLDEAGLDLPSILDIVRKTGSVDGYEGGRKGLSSLETIKGSNADVIVEATWTNLKTGEPGLTHIRESLTSGKHVITTNKGPIALAYHELKQLAKQHHVFIRFEGTVLSGTPALNLGSEALAGLHIHSMRGIVNGTTNYILTQMEEGKGYVEALREAQRLGYAEADPTMDVEGWDAVGKIVILANAVMDGNLKVGDVERTGITGVTLEDVERARLKGRRIKLIAQAWQEDDEIKARVSPERIPQKDLLAQVGGTLNALIFATDGIGEVAIIGRGAGGIEAGHGLLSDLIAINRHLSADVGRAVTA